MAESDQALMQLIHDQYGATLSQVTAASSVPPAFLAGLIANESGGNPNAKRFESGVLTQLWAVVMGRKSAFGSIGRTDLLKWLGEDATFLPGAIKLDQLSTSWGLTQIMGYHVFDLSTSIGTLQTVEGNLTAAIRLLTQFGARFNLDLNADAADLFRCWNTGRPDGVTFDPSYAQNGLARLQLYETIAA